MAKETMALLDYLRNVGVDGDFLREAVRVLSQVVMEQEVGDQIGAGRYERTDSRKTYRNVDDMLQAIGLTRFDKSRVSRVCKELTKVVTEFRERELGGTYPYVWLDALYLKVRQNHRIVNRAMVIAIGVRETGGLVLPTSGTTAPLGRGAAPATAVAASSAG